jgi:hypothetical protein
MTKILRLYPIVDGQEICVREPKEIVKILSNPKEEIDLDFEQGGRVKMGSSSDFIGETVQIGDDLELEIPAH